MLYLIHFDKPFGHARHYLGYSKDSWNLGLRIKHHRQGNGARLMKHVSAAGIKWQVARIWQFGSRTDERKLKQHGSVRYCPICNPEHWYTRGNIRGVPYGD